MGGTRDREPTDRRLVLTRLWTAAVVLIALTGCGSSSTESATTTVRPTTESTATTVPPTTEAPTTTAPATTEVPPDPDEPIEIIGDVQFIAHVEAALGLLQARAPEWHGEVLESVDRIEFVEAGSGMDVYTQTFRVGRETAYAPGYGTADQLEWLAGAIVHDACHAEEFTEGREWIGRDAELACLMEQADSLALHEEGSVFFTYVSGLIDGIDDPANAYWNDPNRHW